jgi:UDP-glucose 4-epimerase
VRTTRQSFAAPLETFAVNVFGTGTLLESVRKAELNTTVIIATSDKCYENKQWLWGYREADSMGGFDPYSSSKGCPELVTDFVTSLVTCTLTATPTTTTVIADTTVRQGSATSNFGTLTSITVSSASGANQRIYLKFSLTSCNPAIPASAIVRLPARSMRDEVISTCASFLVKS